jgi:hypothetical protein
MDSTVGRSSLRRQAVWISIPVKTTAITPSAVKRMGTIILSGTSAWPVL